MTRGTMLALGGGLLLLALSCCCLGGGCLVASNFVAAVENDSEYDERVWPVEAALLDGRPPDPVLIRSLAESRATRAFLVEVLDDYGRFDLMPPDLAGDPSLAEADLARWLTYPTELDAEPDRMELAAIATLDYPSHGTLRYFAFRFTAPRGHWASGDGWMFGIAGPFAPEGAPRRPDLFGLGTFSELEPFSDENVRALVAEMHELQVSGVPVSPGAVRVEIVPLR